MAALAALGGSHASANNICVTALAPATLVYPANGAKGVPDGKFTLVLSHAEGPVSLAIDGVSAVPQLQSAPSPSPLPSGSAAGTVISAAYAVPALQPKTTYQVMAPLPVSGCYDPNHPPEPKIGTLGSFTTQ
jgi:hypothetical protein